MSDEAEATERKVEIFIGEQRYAALVLLAGNFWAKWFQWLLLKPPRIMGLYPGAAHLWEWLCRGRDDNDRLVRS